MEKPENITEKLIECVKGYRILYDLNHPDYKNIRTKNKTWDEVGSLMGMDGEELKKKWKNLRDSYGKCLRSQTAKPGQVAKCIANYKTWPWAEQMEFFKPFLHHSQAKQNSLEFIEVNMESSKLGHQIQNDTINSVSNKRKKRATSLWSSETGKVISYSDSANESIRQIKDEIDFIFLGYAATVRKFNHKRQARVKYQIAKLLMEEELQHIEENSVPSISFSSTSDTIHVEYPPDYHSNASTTTANQDIKPHKTKTYF